MLKSALATICLPLLLCGCADPTDPTEDAACAGATALIMIPLAGAPDAWPDAFWTVEDKESQTGLRLHLVPGENLREQDSTMRFRRLFADLSLLDGFGTTASLTLRLSGPLDPQTLPTGDAGGRRADSKDSALLLVNLDSPALELVDLEVAQLREDPEIDDPAVVLLLSPMTPLKEKTRYGLAVTTRARDAAGACLSPSPAMRQILRGQADDPRLQRLLPGSGRLVERLVQAGVIAGRGELSAVLTFTTQHTTADSAAVAADIRKRAVGYTAGACQDTGKFVTCDGLMSGSDYRTAAGYLDEKQLRPQAAWKVPVVTYLPKGRTPPFPTLIYGHGLNGDRTQAERLAELAAPRGFATVAIDALKHGQHPDGPRVIAALDFFGLSTKQGSDLIDSRLLRDHFRQSAYDKLQLVEMLRPGVDVDQDGRKDVDTAQLIYLGVSLGGLMAAEFLAFAPDVQVAMPIVPGARVTDIVRVSKTFSPAIELLRGAAPLGEVWRFFPMLQTAIDRGDPGVYAAHIVRDRLPGFDQRAPQLLMQMVIDDDTVPNATNNFYARCLGAPHVGEELLRIGTVPRRRELPVQGNIDAGHTAGVFQYDVVFDGAGPKTKTATHGNVADNPVTIEQTLRFIESGLRGPAEIIDPYRTLGVKP